MAYDVVIKTENGMVMTEIKKLEQLEKILVEYYECYKSVEVKNKKLELKKDGIQKR